jgi:hypothetical protein
MRALGSDVASCGEGGATAIAAALHALAATPDGGAADLLRNVVGSNRSPVILAALLEVAENPAAAPQVRVVAIEGAMRQHVLDSAFLRHSANELATRTMQSSCEVEFVEHAYEYRSESPLPANSAQTAAARLRRIADDAGNPQGVRNVAMCAARELERPVP